LFMVKSQVEILGGNITIDSSENNGTKFRIELE
jgi:chemotaxis protein histidine kinase CheA